MPSRPSHPFASRLAGPRLRRRAALVTLATAAAVSITGVAGAATPNAAVASSPAVPPGAVQPGQPDFGPNVTSIQDMSSTSAGHTRASPPAAWS